MYNRTRVKMCEGGRGGGAGRKGGQCREERKGSGEPEAKGFLADPLSNALNRKEDGTRGGARCGFSPGTSTLLVDGSSPTYCGSS